MMNQFDLERAYKPEGIPDDRLKKRTLADSNYRTDGKLSSDPARGRDVTQLIPPGLISQDKEFTAYVKNFNEEVCREQTKALLRSILTPFSLLLHILLTRITLIALIIFLISLDYVN